jgi:hypothetical protein
MSTFSCSLLTTQHLLSTGALRDVEGCTSRETGVAVSVMPEVYACFNKRWWAYQTAAENSDASSLSSKHPKPACRAFGFSSESV